MFDFRLSNDISLVIILALSALTVVFLFWLIYLQVVVVKMKKKNRDFFAGGKVSNLEELLLANTQSIKTLDKDIQELYNISNQINSLAFRGYHKIGLVRFNPFKEVGGDQSFALAILNGKNNGVTISSLYTRDSSRVYAKSIINGISEKYPLTDEEKEAIQLAISDQKLKNSPSKKTSNG